MTDDLAGILRSLRDLHAVGLLDDGEYAAKLDRLRAQYGHAIVDVMLSVARAGSAVAPGSVAAQGGLTFGPSPTLSAPERPEPLPADLSADGTHFSFGHALIIGIADYADQRLRFPDGTTANDARALAGVLRDPHLAAYPEGQVRLLADAKATRNYVLDAMEELAHVVEGGTALIYFAGHGMLTDDGYVLLPHDADPDNLLATGITTEVFQRRVAKVRERARRLVVLLNCCQNLDEVDATGQHPLSVPPPSAFYRPLATGGDHVVICSARPDQRAGARSAVNPRHTIFGEHLLLALAGQAPGSGPAIGVFDLFAYLRVAVPADGRSLKRREILLQEPLIYTIPPGNNLPVALRPAGAGEAGGNAAAVRRLVELELRLETADAPASPALLAERDELLATLAASL